MKPANVEVTMGHDLGTSESYWKPTEREVLEDFLKAVPLLTINGDNQILQKQVEELTEKTNNNDYLLKGKLREKEEEIHSMKEQFNAMQSQLQTLISTLGNIKDQNKIDEFSKTLFESGILKTAKVGQ